MDKDVVYHAAKSGNVRRLKSYLSKKGKDEVKLIVHTKTNGATPLIMACKNGHMDVVEYLIKTCGADVGLPGAVTFDGESIADAPPLWCAAAAGHLPIVEYLITNNAKVNQTTQTNSTPLRAACFDGHLNVVKCLIDRGADVEIANRHGHTCLMIACYKGHGEIVKYLLSKGVDVNRRSVKGNTALHDCAEAGSLAIMEFLTAAGARMAKDSYGMTPLLAAAVTGHSTIVKYVIGQSDVTRVERIEAYELLGATYVDKKKDMAGALRQWKTAIELRLRHPVLPVSRNMGMWATSTSDAKSDSGSQTTPVLPNPSPPLLQSQRFVMGSQGLVMATPSSTDPDVTLSWTPACSSFSISARPLLSSTGQQLQGSEQTHSTSHTFDCVLKRHFSSEYDHTVYADDNDDDVEMEPVEDTLGNHSAACPSVASASESSTFNGSAASDKIADNVGGGARVSTNVYAGVSSTRHNRMPANPTSSAKVSTAGRVPETGADAMGRSSGEVEDNTPPWIVPINGPPPVQAYGYAKEASSLSQLQEVGADPESMRMQALLVRERILGPAHPDTSYYIRYRGAVYADSGHFDRCVELWMYALDMQLALLEPLSHLTQSSLLSFAELFSFMLAVAPGPEGPLGSHPRSPATDASTRAAAHSNDLVSLVEKACGEVIRARERFCKKVRTKNGQFCEEPMDTSSTPSYTPDTASTNGTASSTLPNGTASSGEAALHMRHETGFNRLLTIVLHLIALMLRVCPRSSRPLIPSDIQSLNAYGQLVSLTAEESRILHFQQAVRSLILTEAEYVPQGNTTLLHMASTSRTSSVGRYPVCTFPSPGVTRCLLRLGADASARDASGDMPLHVAISLINDTDASSCESAGKTVCALLEGGAPPFAVDAHDISPMSLMLEWQKMSEDMKGDIGWGCVKAAVSSSNPLMRFISLKNLCSRELHYLDGSLNPFG